MGKKRIKKEVIVGIGMRKWATIERIEIYDEFGFVITDPRIQEGYDISGFPVSRCVIGFYL